MTPERKTQLMKYKAIIVILKQWLSDGHITSDDYARAEAGIAQKYEVSGCLTWREFS